MQANGVIHGEERMSMRNDEMRKTISLYALYSYVCFVSLVEVNIIMLGEGVERRKKVLWQAWSDHPDPRSWLFMF